MKLYEKIVENKCSVSEVVIRKIKDMILESCSDQVILFGAGIGGGQTRLFLKKYNMENAIKCFVDNNPLKQDKEFNGIKILSCEKAFTDYRDEVVLVSCGEGDEIIKQLQKYDVPQNRIYIPDINAIDETDPNFIRTHMKQLNNLYELLEDEKSKDVLVGILNYKMTHDMAYISKIADSAENQYFDKDLIQFNENDIFLDCGAYIGDTAEEYIRHSNGVYGKIICLEADEDNYNILLQKAGKLRIEPINIACWSETTSLAFDKIGSGSGTLLVDRQAHNEVVAINTDTIDHIVRNEKIAFIKMDIEGAEQDALLGARHVIERDKPTLMISVYHRQDDLLRLPPLIQSMNYEYKFYLRHYRCMSVQETVLYAI